MSDELQKLGFGADRAEIEAGDVEREPIYNYGAKEISVLYDSTEYYFPSQQRLETGITSPTTLEAITSGAQMVGVDDTNFSVLTGNTDLQTVLDEIDSLLSVVDSMGYALLADGSVALEGDMIINDDTKLLFGDDSDGSIEFDSGNEWIELITPSGGLKVYLAACPSAFTVVNNNDRYILNIRDDLGAVIGNSTDEDGMYVYGPSTLDGNLTIGSGKADTDYTITISGETYSFLATWMEDEDYLKISDELLMNADEKIHFRDTAIGMCSQADTFLDIFADGGLRIGDSSGGAPTEYAMFAADGELTLHGNARVTKELRVEAGMLSAGASAAAATLLGDYSGWSFTINDDMVGSFTLPHDWDSSTDLSIKIYWYINEAYASASAEVQWQIEWSATPSDDSETIDSPSHSGTIDFGDQNIPATAKNLTKTGSGAVAAASLSAGDLIGLTIKRITLDAGTNPGAEPVLIHVSVEYTSSKLGTAL